MLSEVTPELQQLNREAHPRLPFGALWYTGTSAINGAVFPEKNHAIDHVQRTAKELAAFDSSLL
jgi:hypothetical protein